MPKFTILREGRVIDEITLEGERIEMGSANTCQLFIDDLLIALKQAVFVREESGESYRVEPLSRVPTFKLDGQTVSGPVPVVSGATLTVEGYEIKIAYQPSVPSTAAEPPQVDVGGPVKPKAAEPPLPEPLEPDLPPPLESSEAPAAKPAPAPRVPPEPGGPVPDLERTVFVRKLGRLTATSGPLAGQSWDIREGETKIGRDTSQNQIVIRFDTSGQVDTSISRRHASIHAVGDRLYLEDQSSAAGTFVNGQQALPGQRIEIRNGDMIEIRSARASTVLKLECGRLAAAPSPPPPSAPAYAPPPPEPLPPLPSAPPDFAEERAPAFDPILSGAPERRPPSSERDNGVSRSVSDDNPFLPRDEGRGSFARPWWIWVIVAVAVIVIGGLIFIALT